jgi:uncharacterized protein DUF6010
MHPPPLLIMDFVGPVIGALVFVIIMSLVSEPARRTINAMIVAGASGAYLSGGGFGIWEVAFPVVALPIAYRGLRSYSFIGLAWLMHSCWDIVHHLWGNPIWPFMPTSSFGCLIFDALIAIWFLAGAPSLVHRTRVAALE